MIKEWSQKEWLLKRNELEKRLKGCKEIGYFNVKRYGANIAIEGSCLPMIFGDDGKVKVWNRVSRHSGYQILISDLVEIERTVQSWVEEQKRMETEK